MSARPWWNLQTVLLLELDVGLVKFVDTVNHLLDKLDFGVTETVLVGNVVGGAGLTARFTAGTAGLQVQFLALGLQFVDTLLGPAGQVNVDRGAHAGTQVGGAGVDVAELFRVLEVLAGLGLDGVLDGLDTSGEALEDLLDVAAVLHGDDAELILLIDPDEEGLGVVVEDTTTLGPVALHTGHGQVAIAGHEQEMVVDELLTGGLVHTGQGVVLAGEIAGQLGEGVLHQVLNVDALLLGDAGGETESLDGATDADSGRVDGDFGVDVTDDLGRVHVGGVLEVIGETVVFADEGVENIGEVGVGILVTGVDTAMLVVEFDGASDGLGQSEAGRLGDDATELLPLFGGDVLGDQAVSRLDFGERSSHCFLLV